MAQAEWIRRWWWVPGLMGIIGMLIWVLAAGETAVWKPIRAVDREQARFDTRLPVPQGSLRLQQTFTAAHDGLDEISLRLARATKPQPEETSLLTLQLQDDAGQMIATADLPTAQLSDQQMYPFRFTPQPNANGRRYTLQISGSAANQVSVWGYSLDVISGGQLTLISGALESETATTAAHDLQMTTRYQLTLPAALRALGEMVWQNGGLFLLALLVLPLPGIIWLTFDQNNSHKLRDGAVRCGVALALGIALWPLLWQGVTLLGLSWARWSLWLVVIGGWLVVVVKWRMDNGEWKIINSPLSIFNSHLPLLLILIAGFAVRLLAVRDLAFPAWVDASRHGLITAVMAESGQIIETYAPFLSVTRFPYHFGFHTLSATSLLLKNGELPATLLFLGQFLNALMPLSLYTAVWLTVRRRGAALLAAFLVALPFFFPAYYATWGRFTQLTAMLLLPPLLALTWLLLRGGRGWRAVWPWIGVLAAGLFYIHIRVFLIYLPFVALVWLGGWGRHGRFLLRAGGLGAILAGPRMVQLWTVTDPVATIGYQLPNYNSFPTSYVTVGWERPFLYAAAVGVGLVLVANVRLRRWAIWPLTLVGWVALLFILLAGERLGLPETSLININSMYITLFAPLAIFLAVVVDRVWRWLRRQHWIGQAVAYAGWGALLTALMLFGARQQISILNPTTILARPADSAGLAWVDANVPPEATLAVNSWLWLGGTWAGQDGGAWLVPLTGRATTTPPADYIYDADLFVSVAEFNGAATAVADWRAPETAAWLRAEGVTHIFIGQRGGFLDPATLAANPQIDMLYGRSGVFVFAVLDE